MPRAGLSPQAVTEAAAELADAEGLDAVTLAALAARLGVRPPSLYAHVAGLDDLRGRLSVRGLEELAQALQMAAAGRAGRDALAAVAWAYRGYAHEHPGTYAALQSAAGRSERETAAAGQIVDVVLAVLAGYGLQGEDAVHATRAVRASLHGFAVLEAEQGFGLSLDPDESFEVLIGVLDRGLRG